MSNQHQRENDFSEGIPRLEEAVSRLTLGEERVPQNPPTADGIFGPRNLEEEYLVESQLRSSLQEQLRTMEGQLRTMEGQLRIKDKQLQTQQRILTSTRMTPKSDGVDRQDADGRTLLHKAAMEGDLEAVTRLVWCEGADTTMRDNKRQTPLHFAAENGHEVVCATLLETQGVDVNAKNNYEETPLHWASREGKAEVVRLLLEKGADATLRSDDGSTPLHFASFRGHEVVCATLLKAQGVDVNAKDKYELTPLHLASHNEKAEVVRLLLEKGAKTTLKDRWGRTPLHLPAEKGYRGVCATLLKAQDIDVNAMDNKKKTPLHRASLYGKAEVVQLLLENRADASLTDERGHTPFVLARNEEIRQMLSSS